MKIIPGARTFDLDEFLIQPLFAHLATVAEDQPRESPVWFLWEAEKIWIIANERTDTFPARIKQTPHCAIGIVFYDQMHGKVQHVGFRGCARVVPFDLERAKRLLRRYLGENERLWDTGRFIDSLQDNAVVLVCFTPETVVVRDQSYPVHAEQVFQL